MQPVPSLSAPRRPPPPLLHALLPVQGCTVYQQCAVLNASPTPSPQVQIVTIATTQDPADVAAGFFGGVFATAMAGVAFSLFTRIRYGRR